MYTRKQRILTVLLAILLIFVLTAQSCEPPPPPTATPASSYGIDPDDQRREELRDNVIDQNFNRDQIEVP